MDVLVQVLLGFVEAAPACEDDTGAAQQRAFGVAKAGRSTGKIREFIHAVIHDRRCIQMVAEPQRHRRVVPQHLGPDVFCDDQIIKEPALHVGFALAIELAKMRHDDTYSCRCVSDSDMRPVDRVEDRFFNDKDASISGATSQQMLRALEHEVPTQVGKTKDVALHSGD